MGCMGLFLKPLGFFVAHPFLAFFPAVLFLAYYAVRRPAAAALETPGQVRWSLVAGLVWTGYAFWELSMDRWSRTIAGAPIRIDLFLVGPLLYVLTAAAVVSGISFEKTASRGLDPVKPIRPGPYALTRNRGFVIGLAAALIGFALFKYLVWHGVRGMLDIRGLVGFLAVSALAVFLVRGYRWARWLLLLWFLYGAFYHFTGWSSLRLISRDDMALFRISHLASLAGYVVLGAFLLLSKRLREHLDVHSFPGSTSISPR